MKHLFLIFSIFLFSCSSNNDDVQNTESPNNGITPTNPTANGRYKISFTATGNSGEKHFKAIYKFDNGTPQIVNYDGLVTPSGFATGDATQRIDLLLEMKSGTCYLKNVEVKVEDLQTGTIKYQQSDNQNIIFSPDMLTNSSYLSNIYGRTEPGPINYYRISFHGMINYGGSSIGIGDDDYYVYKNDVLVQKPTRGSMRIVIKNSDPSNYNLSVPNSWAIRDYEINAYPYNYTLSNINNFDTKVSKTYEFILPDISNIAINLKGKNVTATIDLMRKNGSTETVNITSTNNQLMTKNFSL